MGPQAQQSSIAVQWEKGGEGKRGGEREGKGKKGRKEGLRASQQERIRHEAPLRVAARD